MANEFIVRKGYIALEDSQITGSLSVTNSVTASFFTGSFRGDGSQLSGVSAGFPYTGSATISGSLEVTGSISTDTDATINSLTVGKGGGNLDTNTAVGYNAFSSNTGGNFNVAMGYNALASIVEGDDNVAIGYNALSSSLASMGPNTAVGRGALQSNVYGFRNTAVGNASLFSNTQGVFNTAVGNTALVSNTEGNENIAVGDGTLNDNTEGNNNTGVGTFALYSNTGGNNNTALGHSSLYNNLTGSNNIAIGTDAGLYAGSGFTGLTSVNNSIFVGYRARALNTTGDTNEIVIGHNTVGSGSNTTVIGNNSTVSTTLKGAVSASIFSGSFRGDGSQLTGIADPTPITATINNTNSPFTVTSQSIVIIDSTNGDVTVNLPDLDLIDGTPDQKPILLYKNDYSQNVIYVQPSGSQLVNGTTQDIIVSIQIAIAYNPTSAGWVTEGTSYQSLAELEMFFVPRTETGSFATTGSNQFSGSQTITGSLTVTGNITGNITGSASTASYVEYANVANKPALVSGSSQITYSGLTGIPSGILSGSTQIAAFGYATTGSNGFNGNQAITGSLTVTGQVVAQTLNVQQVTSSIVYSSGSNIFGNSLANTQQFTGSVGVTGSLTVTTNGVELQVTNTGVNLGNALTDSHIISGSLRVNPSGLFVSGSGNVGINTITPSERLSVVGAGLFGSHGAGSYSLAISNNDQSNVRLRITNAGSGGQAFSIVGGNPGASNAGLAIYDETNAATRLYISSTGAATFSGSVTATGGTEIPNGQFYRARRSSSNLLIDLLGIESGTDNTRLLITGDFNIKNGSLATLLNMTTTGVTTIQSSATGTAPQLKLQNPVDSNSSQGAANNLSAGQLLFGATGAFPLTARIESIYGADASFGRQADLVFSGANGSGTLSERMRITSGGNVGIGTDNPQSSLHIYSTNATAIIQNSSTSAVGNLSRLFYRALLGSGAIGFVGFIDGVLDSTTQNTGYLKFHTYNNGNADERMRITSGGNLQINTTNSPTARLHIADALVSTMLRLRSNNDTSTSIIFTSASPGGGSDNYTINHSMIHGSGQGYQISHDVTARWIRMIAGTGGVELAGAATSWTSISDIRKKDVLQTGISNALDKIDSIDAIFYKYKNEELLQDGETLPDGIVELNQPIKIKQRRIGLIAQQIQEVLPEAVTYNEEEDTYRLSYTEIIPLLVESIKELKAEIQTLKQ